MKIFSLFGEVLIEDEKAKKSLDEVDKKGEKSAGKLSKLAETAGKVTLALGAIGAAAVTALGAKAVNAADSFAKAMNDLQAETGASNEEMAEFEEIATRLYNNNLGESFEDIAAAISEVRRTTGLTGEELEAATRNAILLRDTFEMDVNETTRTANTLMKQFGITADEAFTLIAQGAQNGANKNGDLLDTLNEYAPQFKALGFDAEQFTNILIDGAQNGAWSIDKIGDAIKEFNIRAKDLSKTSLDAFKALGLSGEEMSAAFAAGGESAQQAFQTVITKLGELNDPLERNRIGVALFGTQFEDLEADAILAFGNIGTTASATENTLQQINEIKYDSFGEALQGIGRNFETGVLIPLGERVLPILELFAQWIIDHMPEIQDSVNSALDIAIGLFEGFATAIQWVIDNANILTPIIVGLTAAIAAQAIIDGIIKLYRTWSTVTKTQTTMQWLLNAALNANPLGLIATIIGAVIAAGVLLWQNWDTVKAKATELWEKLKEVFGNVRDWIVGVWDGIWGGIKGALNNIINGINTFIRGLNKINFDVPDWVPGLGGKEFGINIPLIPKLATGTDFFKGGLALVGEQGPELVSLPRGSEVMNNTETELAMNRRTPEYIQNNIYIDGRLVAKSTSRPMKDMTFTRGRGQGVLSPL